MALILCSVTSPVTWQTVFDYVADSEHHSLWQRDLLRSDAPAPNLVEGSSWTEFRKFGSRELKMDVTLTGSTRPERISLCRLQRQVPRKRRHRVPPEGTRTRVVHHTEFSARGVSAALTPLIARRARHVIQANLYRLTSRFAQVA
ncbi:MAG: hypothetical protein M3N95_15275 [Actinomycetota bacterium]|nr:hypothetical protein [Actinomycetota bacterium]